MQKATHDLISFSSQFPDIPPCTGGKRGDDENQFVLAQLKDARFLALQALLKIEAGKKISDVVAGLISQNPLNDADRRLLTKLVYEIMRWRGQIDWIIDKYIKYRPDNITLNILRLGVYQLKYLDKVPSYAAINETVELAGQSKKRKNFVNAILRTIQREAENLEFPKLEDEPIEHLVAKYSFPKWLVKRWIKQYGLDWTSNFCRASNQIALISVRTNTLKIARDELIKVFEEDNIKSEQSKWTPEGIKLLDNSPLIDLDSYTQGLFQIQDESAMLVSHVLDPQLGEVIFDVCAGPGGKATHIAQLMKNRGQIFAFDVLQSKLELINQNCNRLGISIVKTEIADASEKGTLPQCMADKILVDTPCSGLGTLRRHPDILWNKSGEKISELSELQLKIISNASESLKPGGVMVYSTCTIEPEENEKVIEKFLAMNSEFTIEPADKFLPGEIDNLTTKQRYLRTYPHLHDIDGTFVARLKKYRDFLKY